MLNTQFINGYLLDSVLWNSHNTFYQFSEGHWKTEVCPGESHQDGNGTGNHFNQGILKHLGIFRLEKPQNEHNTPKYLICIIT